MPTHNHDFAGGARTGDGNNSYSATGITVDLSGEHNHTMPISENNNAQAADTAFEENEVNDGLTTGITDDAGLHAHTITDPTHRHAIAANGGDQPHNNIQPTIWIGNLFVYSGRLFRDAPTGPSGDNIFPPNYPNRIF
jgi:hypothetical protein